MFQRILFASLPATVALLLGALTLPALAGSSSFDFSRWLSDSEGYVQGHRKWRSEPTPMFVYFRTDWCPYCRQFEDELLSDPVVLAALEDMILVRVDPEAGEEEGRLSRRYRVRSYPALFVHSGRTDAVSPVQRVVEGPEGVAALMSPEEFVAELERAARR